MRQFRVRAGVAAALIASAAVVAGSASAEVAPAATGGGRTARDFNRWPTLPADCFELAQRYAEGRGVRKDARVAAEWANVAAAQGHAGARAWLQSRAASDDVYAQLFLGALLRVDKDDKGASGWFARALPPIQKAAEGGDALAQVALAYAHRRGHGVPADEKAARAWTEKAAALHYAPAVTDLGLMMFHGTGAPKNPEDAVKIIEGAAAMGDVRAQLNAGMSYRDGLGVKADAPRAAKWFELAAGAGEAESQFALARMKETGAGIPADPAGARDLYRRAAEQNDATAANNLGYMLAHGAGGPPDAIAALDWYRRAADLKYGRAAANLGFAYRDGIGTSIDLAESRRWFEKAIALDYQNAKGALAGLDELRRCLASKPSTQLFDVPLRCGTRDRLRLAVTNGGARPTREDSGYYYDVYDSARILEGTTKLEIGYTEAGEFAHALYHFPSNMDSDHIVRIAEMVSLKYGKFQKRTGNVAVGPASAEWHLKDGITLRVFRDWPAPVTYLEYVHPQHYAKMKKQEDASDAKRKVNKAAAQSRAF